MKPESYRAVAKALAKLGLVGQMREDRLVVSTQEGPIWPNRGNSFWLSRKQGTWYLSTWLPAGYKVPADQDVVSLCSACMGGPSAMYRVPSEVIQQFRLQELTETEYDRLFPSDEPTP